MARFGERSSTRFGGRSLAQSVPFGSRRLKGKGDDAVEEGGDCAAKRMRNRPCQPTRIQRGANRSCAVALIPNTLGVPLGWSSEDVPLRALVSGTRPQLLGEPMGKVQPPVRGFALRAAR